MNRREHWERIYQEKSESDVSWFQPTPATSLDLIRRVTSNLQAPVIDVGGGASTLVDELLARGYEDVTVLDLASAALSVARQRLGENADRVTWMESDVLTAPLPHAHFDIWHDRAVFHFLTKEDDRVRYVAKVRDSVRPGGHVIVASFAPDGPTRCSGLDVMRYSPEAMHAEFGNDFRLLESTREEHRTPWGATQAFVYCLCRIVGQ